MKEQPIVLKSEKGRPVKVLIPKLKPKKISKLFIGKEMQAVRRGKEDIIKKDFLFSLHDKPMHSFKRFKIRSEPIQKACSFIKPELKVGIKGLRVTLQRPDSNSIIKTKYHTQSTNTINPYLKERLQEEYYKERERKKRKETDKIKQVIYCLQSIWKGSNNNFPEVFIKEQIEATRDHDKYYQLSYQSYSGKTIGKIIREP